MNAPVKAKKASAVEGPFQLPPAISRELWDAIDDAEGCKPTAYPDPESPRAKTGKGAGDPWTIGRGHTGPEVHEGLTWTQAQCDAATIADILEAQHDLDERLPWWRSLNPVRQDAMSELCFNMGIGNTDHGLLSFRNTLDALRRHDYGLAATGLLASKWARQVKERRANRIAAMVRTGKRP